MLRAIFDSHPDMAVPNESHFVSALARRRRRYEGVDGFDVDMFLVDLLARGGFRSWGLPESLVKQEIRTARPAAYADAVRTVFALYARQHNKSRYGDKTPNYVLNIDGLARLFPEARFLHIIRDGRNVALSYLSVPWGPDTVEEAAILWKQAVQRGRRHGRRLGPERYREVRYEQVVEDPEGVVTSLCEFLDLPFDPAMLQYSRRADQIVGGMRHPQTRQALYLPPTKNLRDWRQQMRESDAAVFDVLAGSLLGELGYERIAVPAASPLRIKARQRWLRVQTRRAAHRARKPPGS